jgi:4-hydroxy-tetrahydrodipicolinate synthase
MNRLSRRDLMAIGAGALAAGWGTRAGVRAAGAAGEKPLRGVFIILNTPFAHDGSVDWQDLAREVQFVDRAGAHGIVWPQGSSSVNTLTKEERLRGMQVLADAARGKRIAVVFGVQGKDADEMLEYTRHADALSPDAVIAMPPTTGKSMDDYLAYFRALGRATKTRVMVQTSGGARDIVPSTDLIVALAKEFPHFGYVKEESDPLVPRLRAELAARPAMRGIFTASFGTGWLYELRLGVDGIVTGSGMYADLLAKIWDAHQAGRHDEARDAYGKFLLMRNVNDAIPGADLYVMKKRGIFKTTVRRTSQPTGSTPAKLSEFKPDPTEQAEIEHRFAALKPYLVE